MSPQYERDTRRDPLHLGRASRRRSSACSARSRPRSRRSSARPHWGKLFLRARRRPVPALRATSLALAARLDPRGAFRNDWIAQRS